MDQRQHMETSIMDGLPPVSKDKQWRWRLAPPDQQESTETKLADIHYHRTTAQGSQITTDSTQDGNRGKTSTLPKKENQGAAAHDFRIVGQVQWRRDHRQSITEEVRQNLRRPWMICYNLKSGRLVLTWPDTGKGCPRRRPRYDRVYHQLTDIVANSYINTLKKTGKIAK